MNNIKKIGFQNFRVFKEHSNFEIAPLTILTGGNSSGKSTVIKGLKLMQQFWAQNDSGHNLNFSDDDNNHQLGNFEMSLTKNSTQDFIVFSYDVEHIAFESLSVELYFKEKGDELKDGILIRSVIKDKRGNTIFKVKMEKDKNHYYYNYEYIIHTLLPKIESLREEYNLYLKKTGGVTPNTVSLFEDNPDPRTCEEICKDENIDYDRFMELETMFLQKFWFDYSKPELGSGIRAPLDEWQKGKFLYDSTIISLFAQMHAGEFALFEENLWSKIVKVAPDAKERFNVLSFKNRIDELQLGAWVNDFLISGDKSFSAYYRKCLYLVISEFSSLDYNEEDESFMGSSISKFYEPNITYSLTFFDKFAKELFDKQTPLSETEQRIVNCRQIISDAEILHQLVSHDRLQFPFQDLSKKIKLFIRNITFRDIEMDFDTIYFVNSIRASSHRFYSFASHESPFHLFIKEFLRKSYKKEEKEFITKWLKEFEVADDFVIDIIEGAGSQIYLVQGEDKVNLVDLGYGVTQFLPIVLKIAYCNNIGKKTIVIEEPETNLHPRFQSKLAELFMDAYKMFGINFILETHSEYLIRKLQYLTAKGDINTNQTVIHYIGNPDKNRRAEGEEQIISINIKRNGHLSRPFGTGFLDEADNLAMSLLDFALN